MVTLANAEQSQVKRATRAAYGVTLAELAARMVELGCVTALNLDGGGSTTIGVTYPDQEVFQSQA